MNENDTTESTIESALRECDAHIQTLSWGTGQLKQQFPLTESTLHDLDPEQIARVDQFIYRFTKLQDAMARRLFPALYAYFEADNEPRPFLDILNRLEQLGIVTSTQTWQEFRALRNNLAHDYPESADRTVATLNELFDRWQELADMFRSAQQGYRSRSRG